jgi:hypothetical protein
MTQSQRHDLPADPPMPAHVGERTGDPPARTRTLVMGFAPSWQEARTLVRVPPAPLADAPPESLRIRQALDEMSLVIHMPRDLALEVSSLTATALQNRIADASDETLDGYLESLRGREGIEVTDGPPLVMASATPSPPEPEPETTRPTERSAFLRRGWSRTVPMPPTLEALAPRRPAAAPSERVRGAPKLFGCSLVLGAAIAFVAHGASAAAAEPSQAMRSRGAAAPAAPAGYQPTASADEAGSGNDTSTSHPSTASIPSRSSCTSGNR